MGTWIKNIPPKMLHDKFGVYKGQWMPEMDRAWIRKEDGTYQSNEAFIMMIPGTGGNEYLFCVKPCIRQPED